MKGFADTHNHQFAYLGFGGMAFHGRAFGAMKDALPWCTAVHGAGGVGDAVGNIMKAMYGGSIVGHLVGGYPQFDGWPRWDSITHQSVYEDWLYRAVEGGLRLMVMLAVNNEFMCGKANKVLSCNDMEAVDRQIAAAKEMEAYIDGKSGGAGQGWYRIVYTPAEAFTVMEAGKLAVVLGIEVDYLFNCRKNGDLSEDQLRERLDTYYALGVRHIFPIHFGNNGFGGTAFQNGLEWAQRAERPGESDHGVSPLNPLWTQTAYQVLTEDATASGYEYRTGRRNVQGLTDLGKTLIREMIARGMIIDVDHMSARTKVDTLDICEAANYPVVSGHTGFVEISNGDRRHEGQLLPEEVERIRKLGGMVNIIPHQGDLHQIKTWAGPGQTVIPHICGNTSNTFVQAYLYAVSKMQGAPIGFGTDFNGLAGLPGPRFGSEACHGGGFPGAPTLVSYPFIAAATGQQMGHSVVGQKTFDFNVDGLAHIGMLPDFIADLQAMGLSVADLEPLLDSAEGYVKMWQRAVAHAEWTDVGHASKVVAMTALDGHLFCATADDKLWMRDPVHTEVDWTQIGHAAKVVGMAGTGGRLFCATADNKLWSREAVPREIDWTEIGHANNVVGMTALDGNLFCATSDNALWTRPPLLAETNWTRIGHANGVRAMAAAPGSLYCATAAGLHRRDPVPTEVDWQQIGTVPPDVRGLASVNGELFATTQADRLLVRR